VITLALSKGRIFDETLPLLAAAGYARSTIQRARASWCCEPAAAT